MSVLINASTSTGLVQSADTSGVIELQSNGTTALTVNTNEGIQILNCLGVGNATPSTSGAGITFPATQSASSDANTLDDYEEGTWTPTIIGSVTAGTASYSGQQYGKYTKVGNLVYVTCYVIWTSGTGTGNLKITGLPFTSSNAAGIYGPCAIGQIETVPYTGTPAGYVDNNGVSISLQGNSSNASATQIAYDAAGNILLSATYLV